MSITYVTHNDIDKIKWDDALAKSSNGLIYANSWYLDIVSPNWDALIKDDYDVIFPLPCGNKMGVSYLVHPLYSQQLGAFVRPGAPFNINDFIKKIPVKFKYKLLRFNPLCKSEVLKFEKRRNLILKLKEFDLLASNFNDNTKRNIKKAIKFGIEISKNVSLDDFMKLKKDTSRADLSSGDWQKMQNLISEIQKRGLGEFRGIYKDEKLISAIFFTQWKDRLCYLFSASNEEAKEMRASFSLVSELIASFSGKGLTLDFEGSVDENIARFFKGFGATEEIYYEWKKWF